MRKGMKAFVKIGTVIMMSTCIAFSNVNASILVNAESSEANYISYEEIMSAIQNMIHSQTNKEAFESIMISLSDKERDYITDIYNDHVNNNEQYSEVCSLLEAENFSDLKDYIKNNITLSEFDELLSIYINHSDQINQFVNEYSTNKSDEQPEPETEETEETTEPEVATLELEDEYPIATQSNSVYTVDGTEYNIADATEYSNEYGTGYYFEDTNTLLVTVAGSSTASGTNKFAWYEQKDNIEKVVITGNVTSVPNYICTDYTKLKSVAMEEGVTSTGYASFKNCSSLTEVILPSGLIKIGDYSFKGCSSLTEVILPETVTGIGSNAFMNCSALNHIVVPASCKSFNNNAAFYGCTSLTSASPILAGKGTGYEYGWTDQIPGYAFYYLSQLLEIEFLDSITSINQYALYGCSSLTEVILPTDLQTISYKSFQSCNSLTTITAYENISSIGIGVFYTSSSTDTTVITDNKIVRSYNWSGDNRNVTFMRLNPITDLDIVIPVNNMSFNIDGEKNFSSDKVKIVNNSPCDVDIFVKNINGENNTVSIVPENTYTDEEWKNLTDFDSIAFMINNTDLAVVYNNSENDENKFINLGKLKSVESEDEVDPSNYTFTTYSAATAKANGRASISSGKAGYVGNGADNYVYWTINVDKTGKYCFGVNGAVSGTRTTYIDANGVNVGSVTHQGRSFSTGFDIYTTVELQAGENIIKLYNNSEYAPDIYNIQLSNEFVTDNTFELQLEAKYPKSYEIETDLKMNYNLTLLFVSKEN